MLLTDENIITRDFSSLIDYSSTSQLFVERELTGYLCTLPGETLQAAGAWIPEIGTRENAFWKFVKAIPKLINEPLENQINEVLQMAAKQGFIGDYLNKWARFDDFNKGINKAIIWQKLSEVKALHDFRIGTDLIAKHPAWIERGVYDG